MILHGHPTAEIAHGNTLANPFFKNKDGSLKTFDFAVANPPFSSKNWTNGLDPANDELNRFEFGIPPAKNGDYAFLLHLLKSLKSTGKGAIIMPHGVLFRGNREADIRRELVRRGYIKGIIGLPPNLFYGTGIPACIIVIDKENAHARNGIFMIDASKGFIKEGNKNRLREQDIHKIVDVFTRQLEIPGYSRMVPVAEIADPRNDYNLNIPRYIDSSEPEDLHDLDAHLNGGIPNNDIDALEPYWKVFPALREALFQPNCRPGYSDMRVEAQRVKPTVLAHLQFSAYADKAKKIIHAWCKAHVSLLLDLKVGDNPRQVIERLSEDLLKRFAGVPLLDKYDIYQRLMDYWAETMQDDMYLITSEGWIEAARPRPMINDKARKIKETPDLQIGPQRKRKKYKMDLLPPQLIVDRYFKEEEEEIQKLEANFVEITEKKNYFEEEHGGDEGALSGLEGSKGITKGNVQQRVMDLKETILKTYPVNSRECELAKTIKKTSFGSAPWEKGIKDSEGIFQEIDVLYDYLKLLEQEAVAKKAVREAKTALDKKVLAKYGEFTEDEIKTLVVKDKWLASIEAAIDEEVRRVAHRLAVRIKELAERYADPLPELERQVEEYGAKVTEHLRKMGVSW